MDIYNDMYIILHLTQLPWDSSPLQGGKSCKDSPASVRIQSQPQYLTLRFRRRRLSHRISGFRPPRRYSSETRPLPHSKCEVWVNNSIPFFICQQILNHFLPAGNHGQICLKIPFFIAFFLSVPYNRKNGIRPCLFRGIAPHCIARYQVLAQY